MVRFQEWNIVEEQFNSSRMRHYESIFTLGNGYVGTRGSFEEDYRLRTPGTFVAGLFDQVEGEVTELPNFPDWTSIEITIDDERFDLEKGKILEYFRDLSLRSGVLSRTILWESPEGKIVKVSFLRFVSVKDQHIMGISTNIEAVNFSGSISVTSALDGQVTNSGSQHFATVEKCTFGERGIYLVQRTLQSGHTAAMSAVHDTEGSVTKESFRADHRRIDYTAQFEVLQGESCRLEKTVRIFTTIDTDLRDLEDETKAQKVYDSVLEPSVKSFKDYLSDHNSEWERRWELCDVQIEGSEFDQLSIRFAIFHLIQMTAWNNPFVSIAAKGLSGEGYKGHVFWDTEIFMLPFFLYNFPAVARNLLMYRYNTLPGALAKASDNGYEGAMFAWESADTGEETTPKFGGIDLKTRKPIRIWTGEIEQHITADIAYAVDHYYRVTGDRDFMVDYGAEIICLTARYWASRVTFNMETGYYEIKGVIGADEYKEFVDNDYYTNAMVKWHLLKAAEICRNMTRWGEFERLKQKLGIDGEIDRWLEIAEKIKLNREGDLLVQNDGYLELTDIDARPYQFKTGSLHANYGWEEITSSQVLKQADVVMLLYLLGEEYSTTEKRVNWDYYEPRTVHDSSLSAAIHAVVASDLDETELAYEYFSKAARIDLVNKMGNSDAGLHAASLGGLWQAVVNGFGGVRVTGEVLTISPRLPEQWKKIKFSVSLDGNRYEVIVTKMKIEVQCIYYTNPATLLIEDAEWTVTESHLKVSRTRRHSRRAS